MAIMSNLRRATKAVLPWPQVKRLGLFEFIGFIGFGGIFMTPFVFGQYSYKTRSGLSGINFGQLAGYEDMFDPDSTVESTTNFMDILKSDVKPGDHY